MIYDHKTNIYDFTPRIDGSPSLDIKFTDEMADDYYTYFLGLRALHVFTTVIRPVRVLFIEPHNTCQLKCTYCYADTRGDQAINVEDLKRLHEKHHFDEVMIFGGDFFSKWDLAEKLLEGISGIGKIFISTNGIGLSEKRLDFILKHTSKLQIQLSMEPREWGQRTIKGRHQNELVGHIKNLKNKIQFSVNCAIPLKLDKWSKSIEGYINEFKEIIGSEEFSVSWQMSSEDSEEMPPWVSSWLLEAALMDHKDITSKHLPYLWMSRLLSGSLSNGASTGNLFNCNAGFGSITIGPDGRLYTCHEEGVLTNSEYRLDPDPTIRNLFDSLKKKTTNMSNDICRKCTAHYTCGGICYTRVSSARCEYERQITKIAAAAATTVAPDRMLEISMHHRQKLDEFLANYDQLSTIIRSETWRKLVYGVLPTDEVAGLAQNLLGISINLETPLSQLQDPGTVRI